MQDNTITLAVDVANNATLVDIDFTRFDQYVNRTVYTAETHTLANPDTLTLYRTFPKASGNYPGQAKAATKFSRNIVVTGLDGSNVIGPQIIEVSVSNPVGASLAQQLEMRQRAMALLDRDDVMVGLTSQLEI